LNCDPTKSTRNPLAVKRCHRPMRYPPGTWVPSVMESPRGMTRTPPLDSALATLVCSATAAVTTAAAAASHLARVRMENASREQVEVAWISEGGGRVNAHISRGRFRIANLFLHGA